MSAISCSARKSTGRFRVGLNYWPARTAMSWWSRFDAAEVVRDFERIAAGGFDSVRIFLTWEDFQPEASRIDGAMVGRLIEVMDCASEAGLDVMPTLFTGHMSGVNWIPPWALGGDGGDRRFRVLSAGRVAIGGLRNWYTDETVYRAQEVLARELAFAVSGHQALWAWDLGNENSNCVVPPDREHGRAWLHRMTEALRGADSAALVTVGLHMEDLEHDRRIGPHEAAQCCDFLTMHGYPGYAPWTAGPTDERLLPFLARITRWLGGGADVLFSEYGVPTHREGGPAVAPAMTAATTALVEEHAAAEYVVRAMRSLQAAGSTGAMVWCHADYAEAIWGEPPLDLAVHERSFGVFRADGSPKPAAVALRAFVRNDVRQRADVALDDSPWLDIEPLVFTASPEVHLPRLFRRYVDVTG